MNRADEFLVQRLFYPLAYWLWTEHGVSRLLVSALLLEASLPLLLFGTAVDYITSGFDWTMVFVPVAFLAIWGLSARARRLLGREEADSCALSEPVEPNVAWRIIWFSLALLLLIQAPFGAISDILTILWVFPISLGVYIGSVPRPPGEPRPRAGLAAEGAGA